MIVMEKLIKILLAILFFLCLLDMPYGFYELVRFLALVGFSILAYYSSKQEDKTAIIIYIALAILFQPIFKIALGRMLWNVVDVVVGLGLLISLFIPKNKNTIYPVYIHYNNSGAISGLPVGMEGTLVCYTIDYKYNKEGNNIIAGFMNIKVEKNSKINLFVKNYTYLEFKEELNSHN